MQELTLKWTESDLERIETIREQQPSKHPGTVRLGRDPTTCDIIFKDQTVSRLHVEIFYDRRRGSFCLRNLKPDNPPMVDEQIVGSGEVTLSSGNIIHLGQIEIKVIAPVTPTILHPPQPRTPRQPPVQQNIESTILRPPQRPSGPTPPSPLPVLSPNTYALQCPNQQCKNPDARRIVPYEYLGQTCPWCGTDLANAGSILLPRGSS
ncbi:MAG: FHA domain-containing protein [Hormoscilla sp. GUM202]|nr:FHA domain-containing protein [Hormoscilla sp. GUM202]